jgi:hypothetical protein
MEDWETILDSPETISFSNLDDCRKVLIQLYNTRRKASLAIGIILFKYCKDKQIGKPLGEWAKHYFKSSGWCSEITRAGEVYVHLKRKQNNGLIEGTIPIVTTTLLQFHGQYSSSKELISLWRKTVEIANGSKINSKHAQKAVESLKEEEDSNKPT